MADQNIQQLVNFDNPLNINIFLHKLNNFPNHWHRCNEIIYVLEGSCSIYVNGKESALEEDGIILINNYSLHSIVATPNTVLLALQIYFSKDADPNIEEGQLFSVDSSKYHSSYNDIKQLMFSMIKVYSQNSKNKEILIHSMGLSMYYILTNNYRMKDDDTLESITMKQNITRIGKILEYIRNNYQSDLSLNSIAKMFSFSPSYLSRLFEKTMHISYKQFVDEQRFSQAMSLLVSTDYSIEKIADVVGFANPRTFVSLHQKMYHCNPSEYRKKKLLFKLDNNQPVYYQEFEKDSYLAKIFNMQKDNEQKEIHSLAHDYMSIDCTRDYGKLHHTFKTFCAVGRAADILKKEVQDMLKTMQREIGYKYIKFHGIFDDALSVYTNNYKNKIIINFSNLDYIFDFLLSINLKPLVQLSFMPKDLAKYPEKETFHIPLVTSEPNSLDEWTRFIGLFINHLLSRYGKKEVESWMFSLWNEPETNIRMFGFKNPQEFNKFYISTYDIIKGIDSNICFGSPSVMSSTATDTDFLFKMLEDMAPRVPDFFHVNFYPMTSIDPLFTNAIEANNVSLDYDEDVMIKVVDKINKLKEKLYTKTGIKIPIYITEWNCTTSHRSLINDTAYKGSYVVRNLIDNYDKLESFGYWSMSDIINEVADYPELFHGGHGLFTRNGIKKPPYYGMEFLAKLKDNLVFKKRDIIVTKDYQDITLVTCNYIHINELFAHGELNNLNNSNRYLAFQEEVNKNLSLKLTGLENGKYLIKQKYVNKNHGSVFDAWHRMFHDEELVSKEDEEVLSKYSVPEIDQRTIEVTDEEIKLNLLLEPHEIRLIEIKRVF